MRLAPSNFAGAFFCVKDTYAPHMPIQQGRGLGYRADLVSPSRKHYYYPAGQRAGLF